MISNRNYAWPVTAVSKVVYDCFQESIQNNIDRLENKTIVVFGAGIRGTLFSIMLENNGFNSFIFTDNNKAKWGGFINKYPIMPVEEALDNKKSTLIFVTVENAAPIKQQLLELGFRENEHFVLLDTDLYDSFIKEFMKRDETDTLILGDCGITHISLFDENKANLSDLLMMKLKDYKCKALGMHGSGMRAYYNMICTQLHMGIKPKSIIMLANFETFTGKHHLMPRTQHAELIRRIYLETDFNSDELLDYLRLTKERFNSFQLELDSSTPSTAASSDLIGALFMKANYMYKLKQDNEGIIYLMKILDLMRNEGIIPLLYIPPVNFMRGKHYHGQKFLDAYESNCHLLKSFIKEKGYEILDLSYILTDAEFADVSTIDESANFSGRVKICDEIEKYFYANIMARKE